MTEAMTLKDAYSLEDPEANLATSLQTPQEA